MRAFHVPFNSPTGDTRADSLVYRAAMRGHRLPAWVPTDLAAEYCDCAINHGDDRAVDYINKRISERAVQQLGGGAQ